MRSNFPSGTILRALMEQVSFLSGEVYRRIPVITLSLPVVEDFVAISPMEFLSRDVVSSPSEDLLPPSNVIPSVV